MPSKDFIQQLQRLFVYFKRHGGRNIPQGISQIELVDDDDLTHWFVQLLYQDENKEDFYVSIELVFSEDDGGARDGDENEFLWEKRNGGSAEHGRRAQPAAVVLETSNSSDVGQSMNGTSDSLAAAATLAQQPPPQPPQEGSDTFVHTSAEVDASPSSTSSLPHSPALHDPQDEDPSPQAAVEARDTSSGAAAAASTHLRMEARAGGASGAFSAATQATSVPLASSAASPPSVRRTARMPLVFIVAPRLIASFIHHGALCSLELMSQYWEQTPENLVLLLIALHETLNPFSGDGRVSVDDADRAMSRRVAAVANNNNNNNDNNNNLGAVGNAVPVALPAPGTYSAEEHQLGMDYIRRAHPHLFRRHVGTAAAAAATADTFSFRAASATETDVNDDAAAAFDSIPPFAASSSEAAAPGVGVVPSSLPHAESSMAQNSAPQSSHVTNTVEASTSPSAPPCLLPLPETILRDVSHLNTAVYDALVQTYSTNVNNSTQQQQQEPAQPTHQQSCTVRMRLDTQAILNDAGGNAQPPTAPLRDSSSSKGSSPLSCGTSDAKHSRSDDSSSSNNNQKNSALLSPQQQQQQQPSQLAQLCAPALNAERVLRARPPAVSHVAYAATQDTVQCVAELWVPRQLPVLPAACSTPSRGSQAGSADTAAGAADTASALPLEVALIGEGSRDDAVGGNALVGCVLRNIRVSAAPSRTLNSPQLSVNNNNNNSRSSIRAAALALPPAVTTTTAAAENVAVADAAETTTSTPPAAPTFRFSLQPSTAPAPGGEVHICEIPHNLTLRCENMHLYGHLRVVGHLVLRNCVFVGSITSEECASVTITHCDVALMPDDRLLRRAPAQRLLSSPHRDQQQQRQQRRERGEQTSTTAASSADGVSREGAKEEMDDDSNVPSRRERSRERNIGKPPLPPPALFYAQRKECLLVLDSSKVDISDDSRLYRLMPEMQPWRIAPPTHPSQSRHHRTPSPRSRSDHQMHDNEAVAGDGDHRRHHVEDTSANSSFSSHASSSQFSEDAASVDADSVAVPSPPPLAAMMTVLRSLVLVSNQGRLRLVRCRVDPGRNTERTIFAEQDAIVDMAYCTVIAAISSGVIVQGCRAHVEHCTFESAPDPETQLTSSSSSAPACEADHVSGAKCAARRGRPPMRLGDASRSTGLIVELGGTLTARFCTARHLYFAFCVIAHSVAHLYRCHTSNVVNGYTVDASSATLDGCSANTNHVGVFVLRKAKCILTDDSCGGFARRCTQLGAAHAAARRAVVAEALTPPDDAAAGDDVSWWTSAAAKAERTTRVASLARKYYVDDVYLSAAGAGEELAPPADADGDALERPFGFFGGSFSLEVRDAALKASGVTLMNARDTAIYAVEDSTVELEDCVLWSTAEAEDAAIAAALAAEQEREAAAAAAQDNNDNNQSTVGATTKRRLEDPPDMLLQMLSGKRRSTGREKWTPAAEAALVAAFARWRANAFANAPAPAAAAAAAAPAAGGGGGAGENNNSNTGGGGAAAAATSTSANTVTTATHSPASFRSSSCGVKVVHAALKARRCLITGFSFGVGAIQSSTADLTECFVAHGINGFTFDHSTCTMRHCGADTAHVGLFALNSAVVEATGTPHVVGVSAVHRTPPQCICGGVPAVFSGDVYGVECQSSEMHCTGVTVLRGRDSGFNVYSKSTFTMSKCLVDMSPSDTASYVFRRPRGSRNTRSNRGGGNGGGGGAADPKKSDKDRQRWEDEEEEEERTVSMHGDAASSQGQASSPQPPHRKKNTLTPSSATGRNTTAAAARHACAPRGCWIDDLTLDVDVGDVHDGRSGSERSRSDANSPFSERDTVHDGRHRRAPPSPLASADAPMPPSNSHTHHHHDHHHSSSSKPAHRSSSTANSAAAAPVVPAVLTSGVKVWSGSRCHAQDSEVRCVTFGFAALGPETSLDVHHCTAKHVVNGFTADGGVMQLTKCSASSNHVGVYVLSHGRCVVRRGSYTAKKYGIECRSGILSFQGHVKIYGFSRIGLYLYENAHCEADSDSVLDIHALKQFTVGSPVMSPAQRHSRSSSSSSSPQRRRRDSRSRSTNNNNNNNNNKSNDNPPRQSSAAAAPAAFSRLYSAFDSPSSLPQPAQLPASSPATLCGPENAADVSDLLPACIALDEATAHLPQAILGGGARCGITCADGATGFLGKCVVHHCTLVGVNVFSGAHLTLANCLLKCARQYAVVVHVGGVCRLTRQDDADSTTVTGSDGGGGGEAADNVQEERQGAAMRGVALRGWTERWKALASAAVRVSGLRLWSAVQHTVWAVSPMPLLRRSGWWRAGPSDRNGCPASGTGRMRKGTPDMPSAANGNTSGGAATLSCLTAAVKAMTAVSATDHRRVIDTTETNVSVDPPGPTDTSSSSHQHEDIDTLTRSRATRQRLRWLSCEAHLSPVPFLLNTLVSAGGTAAAATATAAAVGGGGGGGGCEGESPSSLASAQTCREGAAVTPSPLSSPVAAPPSPVFAAALPPVQPAVVGSCVIRGSCTFEKILLCPTNYLPSLHATQAACPCRRSRSTNSSRRSKSSRRTASGDERSCADNSSNSDGDHDDPSTDYGDGETKKKQNENGGGEATAARQHEAIVEQKGFSMKSRDAAPDVAAAEAQKEGEETTLASADPALARITQASGKTQDIEKRAVLSCVHSAAKAIHAASHQPPAIHICQHGVLHLTDCLIDVSAAPPTYNGSPSDAGITTARTQQQQQQRSSSSALILCEGPYARLHCEFVRVQRSTPSTVSAAAAAAATSVGESVPAGTAMPARATLPHSSSLGTFLLPPVDNGVACAEEEKAAGLTDDSAAATVAGPPVISCSSVVEPPVLPLLTVALRGGAQGTLHVVGTDLTSWPLSAFHTSEEHTLPHNNNNNSRSGRGRRDGEEEPRRSSPPLTTTNVKDVLVDSPSHEMSPNKTARNDGFVLCVSGRDSLLEASYTACASVHVSGLSTARLVHCAITGDRTPLVHLQQRGRAQLLLSRVHATECAASGFPTPATPVVCVETKSRLTMYGTDVRTAVNGRALSCVRGGEAELVQSAVTSMM